MLILYAEPVSLYCAKLRLLLRHKGLDWREVTPPGGYGSDEFRRMVPSGTLPALDDSGIMLGDSEAIAEYLNEKFPTPPMLPTDLVGRARARELSRFHDTRLEPEVRALFSQVDPSKRDPNVITARAKTISTRLSQLIRLVDHRGQDSPISLELGDCGFAVTFAWIDHLDPVLTLDIDWPGPVRAYRAAIEKIPAVRDSLAAYRPAQGGWIAGKLAS